ncbi:MAG TPA: helix-turn-helix transcriptional regulator [Dehalococcoidia bacterium]|nr:helix-turn-helix transcriptional regulator [Dehalococcoidia bacterium]
MKLGDRIRQLREGSGLTQGQLAHGSAVSQGYLSQLENGEVKNPSAAVLLRVAEAMHVDADELFEAAGYPTVRTLRRLYQGYESTVDDELLQYLAGLSREKQRRLLSLLEGIEKLIAVEAAATETFITPQTAQDGSNVQAETEFSKVGN